MSQGTATTCQTTDRAILNDSGGNDTFTGRYALSVMSGPGYKVQA